MTGSLKGLSYRIELVRYNHTHYLFCGSVMYAFSSYYLILELDPLSYNSHLSCGQIQPTNSHPLSCNSHLQSANHALLCVMCLLEVTFFLGTLNLCIYCLGHSTKGYEFSSMIGI